MERIKALIDKLQQQADAQGDIAAMKVTVLMLQAELEKVSAVSHYTVPSPSTAPSKISVVMPGGGVVSSSSQRPAAPVPDVQTMERFAPPVKPEPVVKQKEPVSEPARPAPPPAALPAKTPSPWQPDPVAEMPSLLQQREMNEILGRPAPSINDRLRTDHTELAAVLTEAPVKDLKKAIGINDRFVFLHELFRGDESMYERSIKTINSFRAYPEAEYWIERELKIKLGWDEHKETVKHFMQLVRRRFF